MKILTISDLLCLTLNEILEIRRALRAQSVELTFESVERHEAQATLTNIEIVLARPEFRRLKASRPEP